MGIGLLSAAAICLLMAADVTAQAEERTCPVQSRGCTNAGAPEVVQAGGHVKFSPSTFQQNFDQVCDPLTFPRYRTADGSCNNAFNLGAARKPHKRLLPPAYDDGMGPAASRASLKNLKVLYQVLLTNKKKTHNSDNSQSHKLKIGVKAARQRSATGSPLPSPSDVSRNIHVDMDFFNNMTAMFMQWGQFMDHDFALTPISTDVKKKKTCCEVKGNAPTDCLPIQLSKSDQRFQNKCMEFVRSVAAVDPDGTQSVPREQPNDVTSFIDGSMIYGSSLDLQTRLRVRGVNGPGYLMNTSAGNLLPPADAGCVVSKPGQFCFLAGDVRVNEHPGLAAIHTIWVRFHNVIARYLAANSSVRTQGDEEIFQTARKIVVAIEQNIHYNQWLPLVLGQQVMERYDLAPGRRVPFSGHVDPRVSNEFATAAFRFGHSLVVRHYNVSGRLHRLRDVFSRPDLLFEDFNGMVGALINPSPRYGAQQLDGNVVEELTGHLFEKPGQNGSGLDLVALNLQRGRDHGLRPFNDYRKFCGFAPVTDFTVEFGPQIGAKLASLYPSVDDLDLFTGGMLESLGSMGRTFSCIMGQQFHALKFGDRHYFESDRSEFTDAQLRTLRQMTDSHVLCQSKAVTSIQKDAFLVPSASNPIKQCSELDIEFTAMLRLF